MRTTANKLGWGYFCLQRCMKSWMRPSLSAVGQNGSVSRNGEGNTPIASLISKGTHALYCGPSTHYAFIKLMIYRMTDTLVICALSKVYYANISATSVWRVKCTLITLGCLCLIYSKYTLTLFHCFNSFVYTPLPFVLITHGMILFAVFSVIVGFIVSRVL